MAGVPPKKNTAYTFYIGLEDKANPGLFKASPTLANGDWKIAIDDGAPANLATLPVVDADFTKRVKVALSSDEMNGDHITIIASDAAGAEWYDLQINIDTDSKQIGDIPAAAPSAATIAAEILVTPANKLATGAAGVVTPSGGTINSVSSTVTAQLANGVVHGGTTAELTLKKVAVANTDEGGTGVAISAAGGFLSGRGLYITGANGGAGVEIAGTVQADVSLLTGTLGIQLGDLAKQDVADAGLLAPAAGTPAADSLYDLLSAPASEPAQLDWRAWTTPDGALANLYDDNAVDALTSSGTTLTAEGATGFAAWVLQEFEDELFVGIGKTPMNHIAAVIGSIASAGAAPTFEYALPEEGVSAMTVGSDGKLYVAGVDERTNTGDSSIYICTAAGAWTRKQTVTGWQHICGIREDGLLWIAGQGTASILMYSSDGGDTWTDTDLTLGRAYDVIRLGSYVIATHWDGVSTYTVQRSPTTTAFSWSPVSGIEGGTGRMVEWESVIVGVTVSGTLFTVNGDGAGLEYTPPFTPRQTWNNLAVDTDGYLCVLGTTGVWRTSDLANWKQVWSFSPTVTARSLGTWGSDLVVSTDGATAQVLARPASPEAAQQQMTRDAMLLAPTVSVYATGSVDYYIDRIANGLTGVGLIPLVYTVTEPGGVVPISGVTVELYTEESCVNCVRRGVTNTLGVITFWMTTAGTYWIKCAKDGYEFGLDSEAVSA